MVRGWQVAYILIKTELWLILGFRGQDTVLPVLIGCRRDSRKTMDGSECGRDRPGLGKDSISQKLSPITLYIVVQLLYQFLKETFYKTASCCQVSSTRRQQPGFEFWQSSLIAWLLAVWLTLFQRRSRPVSDKFIMSGSGPGSVTVEKSELSGWHVWHFTSILMPTHEINEDFFFKM